jgi:hypothetical protein
LNRFRKSAHVIHYILRRTWLTFLRILGCVFTAIDPGETTLEFTLGSSTRKNRTNQRNAQKSTGPRTAAGTNRARFNAVTHRLFACGPLPSENREAHNQLVSRLWEEWQPQGISEEIHVGLLARVYVRLSRLDRAHDAYLSCSTQQAAAKRQSGSGIAKVRILSLPACLHLRISDAAVHAGVG